MSRKRDPRSTVRRFLRWFGEAPRDGECCSLELHPLELLPMSGRKRTGPGGQFRGLHEHFISKTHPHALARVHTPSEDNHAETPDT